MKNMPKYACIHVYGSGVMSIAEGMMEKNLAAKAYLINEISPYYRKNNKLKLDTPNWSAEILVERSRLDEAMNALQSLNDSKKQITAYAVPVLAATGISWE